MEELMGIAVLWSTSNAQTTIGQQEFLIVSERLRQAMVCQVEYALIVGVKMCVWSIMSIFACPSERKNSTAPKAPQL